MAKSVFYPTTPERRFNIPLLALEVFATESQSWQTEGDYQTGMSELLRNFCGVTQPEVDDFVYFLERVQTLQAQFEKPTPSGTPKKSFGTAYSEYLTSLPIDSLVLRMVGYNEAAARWVYCVLDRDDANRLLDEYVSGQMQDGLLNMEGAMYGFGNSYQQDKQSSPNVRVHDVNSEEGLAALQRLGFLNR